MDYLDANILWDFLISGKFEAYISEGLARGEISTSYFALSELEAAVSREVGKQIASEKVERLLELQMKIYGISESEFREALLLVRTTRLKMFDAIHAAICVSAELNLATYDGDFRGIKGLKTFKPKP